VPDDCAAGVHADEGGAPVSVHHGLIRPKGELEPRLQDPRTGDSVHHFHGASYRRDWPLS
jgi:hypothetical protein